MSKYKILKKFKFFFVASWLLILPTCAGSSIFVPIPLTLDPLTLANPISLVASNSNQRLYLVNSNNKVLWEDASFIVLDISSPANPKPIAVISIANFSGQIILDEPRGYVYIPNRQSADQSDVVDQVLRINIDESSPGFLTVDLFDEAPNPFGAFYDGVSQLYVAASFEATQYNVNNFAGYTSVNLAVKTAQGRDIDAEETRELAISPSGNWLFVTNRIDNMLIVNINEFPAPTSPGKTDLGTEPVDFIVVGTSSTRGVTSDSSYVYLIDGSPSTFKVMSDASLLPVVGAPQEISTASLQVAAVPIGDDPSEVVLDTPNRRAYVTNTGSDDVSVIDLDLFVEISRISVSGNLPPNTPVGQSPFGLALANIGGTNYVYVANFDSNTVTVIDADALQVVSAFPTGPQPTPFD